MNVQFSRTAALLGEEAIKKMESSRVAIFGIGGVGGYVVEALARSGIGAFELVDDDVVEITNINRQIIALHSTIGSCKTSVAKARILDINPSATVVEHRMRFLPQSSQQIDFSNFDYVIDAIDTVSGKLEIVKRAKEKNIPIISCMGTGNKQNPMKFEISDIYKTTTCPLAKIMRKLCRENAIDSLKVVYSTEIPNTVTSFDELGRAPASNSIVPAVAGLLIASEVIKDLINL